MKHLITFSGGKDSLAVICWANQNLKGEDWDIVFCDTGWEAPVTYQHIRDIEHWIGKSIITLRSKKYKDFLDLCINKGRVPSTKARFCTEELKTKPMIDYILSLNTDVTIYQGVRHEESEARRNLKASDEYFRFYYEPYGYVNKGKDKGKPKFHTWKKADVFTYCNTWSVDVERPIITWSAAQVFDYIFSSGISANPLYYQGFSRVGCFPCIMCRHTEIRLIAEKCMERIDEIRALEARLGRTFFPPDYIPERYCSFRAVSKKGKVKMCPTIDDVITYVMANPAQTLLIEKPGGCVSVYNICEKA